MSEFERYVFGYKAALVESMPLLPMAKKSNHRMLSNSESRRQNKEPIRQLLREEGKLNYGMGLHSLW